MHVDHGGNMSRPRQSQACPTHLLPKGHFRVEGGRHSAPGGRMGLEGAGLVPGVAGCCGVDEPGKDQQIGPFHSTIPTIQQKTVSKSTLPAVPRLPSFLLP